MKKIIVLCLILTATVVFAGTYTITTSTAQDNRLEKQRVRLNKASCQAANLSDSCTQAQCRDVNSSCVIYSTLEDFIDRGIVTPYANALKVNDTKDDQAQFCEFWNNPTTTIGQRNTICANAGLPNGCELCLQ